MESHGLHGFERTTFGDLDLIPLTVRWRLDVLGLKLSLAAWRALPVESRRDLVRPAGGAPEWGLALQESLRAIDAPSPLPVPSWTDPVSVPGDVLARCAALGSDLGDGEWKRLGPERRHALCKLAVSKWGDRMFPDALREFGLLPGDVAIPRHSARGNP